MKKIFILIVLIGLSMGAFAQSSISRDIVEAKDELIVGSESLTADSIKKLADTNYVNQKLSGSGLQWPDTLTKLATSYDLTLVEPTPDSIWVSGRFGSGLDTILIGNGITIGSEFSYVYGMPYFNKYGISSAWVNNGKYGLLQKDTSGFLVGFSNTITDINLSLIPSSFSLSTSNVNYTGNNILNFTYTKGLSFSNSNDTVARIDTNGNYHYKNGTFEKTGVNWYPPYEAIRVYNPDSCTDGCDTWAEIKDFSNDTLPRLNADTLVVNNVAYITLPHAAIYRNTNLTITATQNIWYKITGFTTKDADDITVAGDSLQLPKGSFLISYTASFSGANNEIWELGVSKNGAIEEPTQMRYTSTADVGNANCPVYVQSDGNDWISFKIRNTTDGDDPTILRFSGIVTTQHLEQ